MPRRYEYLLDLGAYQPAAVALEPGVVRPPLLADAEALAALMIDAYVGTIDYGGETVGDALQEVHSFLNSGSGQPLLDISRLYLVAERPVAACLIGFWAARGCPLVAYLMTGASWKGRGLAGQLLAHSLAALVAAGWREVRAVITDGNIASERAFLRAGFRRISVPPSVV
jgi:RimJ/RimL family protein N-acetyltransferase